MGMFDNVEVLVALPNLPADAKPDFQTKSLACFMEDYRIDEAGRLWVQKYDIEDRSDPNATGIMRLAGSMTRINQRWVPFSYTGEVRFYDMIGGEWYEYSAYFENGLLVRGPTRVHDR